MSNFSNREEEVQRGKEMFLCCSPASPPFPSMSSIPTDEWMEPSAVSILSRCCK